VPVLTLFGGLGIHAAVAASIVSVIACSGGSAAPFLRSGLTNIRIARRHEILGETEETNLRDLATTLILLRGLACNPLTNEITSIYLSMK